MNGRKMVKFRKRDPQFFSGKNTFQSFLCQNHLVNLFVSLPSSVNVCLKQCEVVAF